jgi:hypothetical protein
MKTHKVMETIGIKKILISLLFVNTCAYLYGRFFYVPPTYCYIKDIGYRIEETCEQNKKAKIRTPKIKESIQESTNDIELWYYKAWLTTKMQETKKEEYETDEEISSGDDST